MALFIAVSPFSSRKWEWSIFQGNHKAETYSVKCCAYMSWGHHPGHYEVLSRRLFTQEVSQQSRAAPKKGPPRPCLSRCGSNSRERREQRGSQVVCVAGQLRWDLNGYWSPGFVHLERKSLIPPPPPTQPQLRHRRNPVNIGHEWSWPGLLGAAAPQRAGVQGSQGTLNMNSNPTPSLLWLCVACEQALSPQPVQGVPSPSPSLVA